MWRFILQQNIGRYRKILEEDLRLEKRDEFEGLLTSAERELSELNRVSASSPVANNPRAYAILQQAVDLAMDMVHANFGTLRLHHPEAGGLLIAAQRNFRTSFLQHLAVATDGDGSPCGRALSQGTRVVIEDVDGDSAFSPHLDAAREAGFRAVQSTPFFAPTGTLIGVLSTHFPTPRTLLAHEHEALDHHARAVADKLWSVLSAEDSGSI